MKFGKRLYAQRFKDWQQYYISYDSLKKHIKFCMQNKDIDTDGKLFRLFLEKELDKVNAFYKAMERKLVTDFHNLERSLPKFNESSETQEQASKDTLNSFVKYCKTLDAFRSYTVLNYLAVYKIVKKRNKHLPGEIIDFRRLLLEQYFYNSQKAAKISVQCELFALRLLPDVPVEAYRQNFTCPICSEILCNPCLLSCGHRFCWKCISQAGFKKQACPVCKKTQVIDPNNLFVDWILNSFIQEHFPESNQKSPRLTKSLSSSKGSDVDGSESDEDEDSPQQSHIHPDDDIDLIQKEDVSFPNPDALQRRQDMIKHLESLVENMEGVSFYQAPKPLTAFAGALKTSKNFLFTGLLTLLPVYWFLLVLIITMFSYAWALGVALILLAYPHFSWDHSLQPHSLKLRTLSLLHALVEALLDYFPMKLYRTTKLNPNKKYLFGYHPHGVFCFGVFTAILPSVSGWDKLFPGIHTVMGVANSLLCIPILCTLFRRIGFIPVTKAAMNSAIHNNLSIMIVPGGIAEMLEVGDENTEIIYLQNRRGFIRYAITSGLDLVPVYGFGENQTYDRYDWFKTFRVLLSRKLRLTLQPFSGRWFTLIPFSVPLHVIVGKPVPVKKIDFPTEAQVDRVLSQYKYALIQLFEQYKHQVPGYSDKKLVIK